MQVTKGLKAIILYPTYILNLTKGGKENQARYSQKSYCRNENIPRFDPKISNPRQLNPHRLPSLSQRKKGHRWSGETRRSRGGGAAARGEGSEEEAEEGFQLDGANSDPEFILSISARWSGKELASSARYINAVQNSAGHEECRARFSRIAITDRPHNHLSLLHPPPPLLSPSFDRDFLVFLLSECTRITWPNTLPAEFLQRPSFHRVEYLFGRLIALVPSP